MKTAARSFSVTLITGIEGPVEWLGYEMGVVNVMRYYS